MRMRYLVVVTAVVHTITAASGVAQREPPPPFPGECRALARELLQDQSQRLKYAQALSRCKDDGPPVLTSLWVTPPTLKTEREVLVAATVELRDYRIFQAVRTVALNVSNGTEVRISALEALVGYFDPGAVLMSHETAGDRRWAIGGWGHYTPPTDGAQPLPTNIRNQVLEVFRSLATDTTSDVGRAAKDVLYSLEGLARWTQPAPPGDG